MTTTNRPIRRALVSVFHKEGIEVLAEAFIKAGTEVVSTGSTAKRLAELGVKVTEVSEVTGFPECLDGRVKTLDPHIHAGILADMTNENHAARHGIDRLLEVAPRHPEVLRLAEQAYIRTGAWGSLLDIIPSMAKAEVGDDEHRDELQRLAWIGLMDQARADLGSDGLKTWWKNQSRKTRQQVPLQVAMAEHLIECDDHDTAQEILLDGLKRQYDDRLVMVIPRLKTNNPEQIEKVLRQQIKSVGDRPLLWSTLGQSLMKHGEWQEASLAFRAALKQRPDAFDYAWLADTLDKQHKPEEAAAMRRDGLLLTLQNNGTQQ